MYDVDRKRHRAPSPPLARQVVAVVAGIGLAVVVGCSQTGPEDDFHGNRALQAVETSFDTSAAIEGIDNTLIVFDDESATSRSETEEFEVGEVVDDLPLRVSTQYRTEDGTGTDLADLDGYSGRVEIGVTLENLLVSTEEISYDVAGESRQTSALVGVPISVAASAEFEDTSAGSIISADDDAGGTNGVIGAGPQGQARVQWATVLAPPQTEAAATLKLVADVKDFDIPTITISAQPGLRTDLSFNGVMESVFGPDLNAELAAQQEAISTVIEVNDVLNRAGETITELRLNLNETSDTLGIDASQALQTSTEDLTARMEALEEEILALDDTLSTSLEASETQMGQATEAMLQSALDLLGTSGTAPAVKVEGTGCDIRTTKGDSAQSIYGQFQYVSALLGGYADAADSCRGEIKQELEKVIGPEQVSTKVCKKEDTASVTCALHDTRKQVNASLKDVKKAGQRIINQMTDQHLRQALTTHEGIDGLITTLNDLVDQLPDHSPSEAEWHTLGTGVADVREALDDVEAIRQDIETLRADTLEHNGAIRQGQQDIAQRICDLSDDVQTMSTSGSLDPQEADDIHDQLDEIRAQIVQEECDGTTPYDPSLVDGDGTVMDALDDLDADLEHLAEALDPQEPTSVVGGIAQALDDLEERIDSLEDHTDTVHTQADDVVADIKSKLSDVAGELDTLDGDLASALHNHEELKTTIEEAIDDAVDQGQSTLDDAVDDNIDHVNQLGQQHQRNLAQSYSSLIDGLRKSADSSLEEGKSLVEEQENTLVERQDAAMTTFEDHTVAALERIEGSSQAASQNISAASQQLGESLQRVILDLGDPEVEGSGILGAIATNAAMTDTADYQLAMASQNVSGFANVRSESVEGIMLHQALLKATLEKATTQAPFHLDVPQHVKTQTIYTFTLNAPRE